MTIARVPIIRSAAQGVHFLVRNWFFALGPCLLLAVGKIGEGWVLWKTQVAAFHSLPMPMYWQFGSIAWSIVIQIIGWAGLLRLALRNDRSGLWGLQTGLDELRLGASFLILAAPIVLIATGGLLAAGQSMVLANGPEAMGFSLIALVILATCLILVVRTLLAGPASIEERRVAGWGVIQWTRGNTWGLLASLLVLIVPLAIVTMPIIFYLANSLGVHVLPTPPGEALKQPPPLRNMLIFSGVAGLLDALLIVTPVAGTVAYLYRGLRPQP